MFSFLVHALSWGRCALPELNKIKLAKKGAQFCVAPLFRIWVRPPERRMMGMRDGGGGRVEGGGVWKCLVSSRLQANSNQTNAAENHGQSRNTFSCSPLKEYPMHFRFLNFLQSYVKATCPSSFTQIVLGCPKCPKYDPCWCLVVPR